MPSFVDYSSVDIISTPSPLQELKSPLFERKGLSVWVKRDDLLHPVVSGNKWRKLKYNIQEAQGRACSRILTFGGAYSNHLHATAGACAMVGLSSVGVVRGEETLPLNSTLRFAAEQGMHLHYVSRSDYRMRYEESFQRALLEAYPGSYLVPEGGANAAGVRGCKEIVEEVSMPFDKIAVACGTGATLAGIALALNPGQQVLGFSALKNGAFLDDEVAALVASEGCSTTQRNWTIQTDYHFGGYARITPELIAVMQQLYKEHGFKLDPVYTAKMFYGVWDMMGNDAFARGTTLVLVHTGGLQGLKGMEERLGLNFYAE